MLGRMPTPDVWTRIKQARIVRVVAFYLGACWIVLQVVDILQEALSLPDWLAPVSVVLLLVGGVVMVATALVQGSPDTDAREAAGEVPGSWQVAPKQLSQSIKSGQLPHLTWGRSLLGGLMAFWFLFGLAGIYVVLKDRGESFAPTEAIAEVAGTGVAVVPFRIQGSEDLELWREGMVDLFSTNLDGVGGFRTIDSRTVLARWGERIGDDAAPDLTEILGVASETGAAYAMVGSAVGLGANVRLTADIYDVGTGAEVGQAQVEGPAEDVLTLVDELSVEVMRALLQGAGAELPPMQHTASITTASLPALRAYLESETHYRRSDFTSAIEALERAIDADSTFALAYYRLADAYGWVEDISSDQGELYMLKAREYGDRLPARYGVLLDGAVGLLTQDLSAARRLEEAVRRYPDDPEMWFLLGEFYMHYGAPLLKTGDDADRIFARAVQLDPTFAPYYIHLIETAIFQRDEERTAALMERFRGMAENFEDRAFLEVGHDLVFGDSVALAAAVAAIDTMDVGTHFRMYNEFGVAGVGVEHMEHVARAAYEQTGSPGFFGAQLGMIISGGKIDQALVMLDDERLSEFARTSNAYLIHNFVEPLPPEAQDAYLTSCEGDHPGAYCTYVVGAQAMDQGRWDDLAAMVEVNQRVAAEIRADSAATPGDLAHAQGHENTNVMLEARRAWAEGREREAIDMLEDLLGEPVGPEPVVRYLLGSIHEDLGEPRQAIRYYESFWGAEQRWYYSLRLADLYAELGETDRARFYYALFLEDWANADEGRAEVARARAALEQLGG